MIRNLKYIVLGVLALAVVGGGGAALAVIVSPPPATCTSMAAADGVTAHTPEIVIANLASNSEHAAEEVVDQVRERLAAAPVDAPLLATVRLVAGDAVVVSDNACIGSDLIVTPNDADVALYKSSEPGSNKKRIAFEGLERQRAEAIKKIVKGVRAAILDTPKPQTAAGALTLWQAAGSLAKPTANVTVIGTFAVGGDNCLTMSNPAAVVKGGITLAASRVSRCAASGHLPQVNAAHLLAIPTRAITLTSSQLDAQQAVIDALCDFASTNGCADPSNTKS